MYIKQFLSYFDVYFIRPANNLLIIYVDFYLSKNVLLITPYFFSDHINFVIEISLLVFTDLQSLSPQYFCLICKTENFCCIKFDQFFTIILIIILLALLALLQMPALQRAYFSYSFIFLFPFSIFFHSN